MHGDGRGRADGELRPRPGHRCAEYLPPHEEPGEGYPFALITGRTIYHFHTRTKAGRVPQLRHAAPDVWVEMSPGDAARCGLRDGDLAEISTARGAVRARVRTGGVRDGVLFVPFHYGYWDTDDKDGRAANELTHTEWDPVSEQRC